MSLGIYLLTPHLSIPAVCPFLLLLLCPNEYIQLLSVLNMVSGPFTVTFETQTQFSSFLYFSRCQPPHRRSTTTLLVSSPAFVHGLIVGGCSIRVPFPCFGWIGVEIRVRVWGLVESGFCGHSLAGSAWPILPANPCRRGQLPVNLLCPYSQFSLYVFLQSPQEGPN